MTQPDDAHVLVYVDRVGLTGEVVRLDDLASFSFRSLAAEQKSARDRDRMVHRRYPARDGR